jgi:hypothetical protein
MTRIKTIGLAILAVFAIAAIASAAASAAKNPVLVNSKGEVVTNLAVSSKGINTATVIPTLQPVGGTKIECAAETDTGKVSSTLEGTGMTSGTATVTFTGCLSTVGKCQNTATSGEITGTVSTLLVWVGKESEKKPGILVSILPYTGAGRGLNQLLRFTCGTAKVVVNVEGSFIALTNRALNELFTTAVLIAKQAGGVQEDKKYTENGIEGTNTLFSSSGGGAFAEAGEQIESEETYTTSVKVIEA